MDPTQNGPFLCLEKGIFAYVGSCLLRFRVLGERNFI